MEATHHSKRKRKTFPQDVHICCNQRRDILLYRSSVVEVDPRRKWLLCWKPIHEKYGKVPSLRLGHTAWAYKENLWIFGGCGEISDQFLHDHGEFEGPYTNQLLQFSTVSEAWTNPQYYGTVPKPRCEHSTTVVGDNAYLFGGKSRLSFAFDALYQLNMCSFSWTQIQSSHTRPLGRYSSSLNAITFSHLVLHAGYSTDMADELLSDTWIFDLQSQSWRQYTSSKDNPRRSHTGLQGINSDIIIFGGEGSNDQPRTDTFHIMLEPKSLQQLATKMIYMHRAGLPWITLPNKLIKLMDLRAEDNTQQNWIRYLQF